ncbi:MAG: exodeoxyribonuclease V subunit gamma [bacterium]|nr:exodeoxyribonuclease V subunit gamma [bacterium]
MQDKILENLNEKQVEAVKIVDGPVLVISGPGSGKTRCLTHRVAYLINQGITPENILAITFTNKASGEMRDRILNLLEAGPLLRDPTSKYQIQNLPLPTIGTFHSIGLRILRNEIPQLGYRRNFTVFDEDDQLSLLKRVLGDLEIDTKSFNPKIILYKISELKTKLTFPENYEPKDYYSEILAKVYKKYQQELKNLNAVDFDDLIVLPVQIFKQNAETLNKYQEFWKYILVDEYQDTSHDQYIFINLLAQKYRNLFAIGDDAQSIYQFRRADIRNILNFKKDYPEVKTVMLEQNYRSTKNIITAAQEIISKNKNQIQKSLWTNNSHGEKILIAETVNERHEAGFVISSTEALIKRGLAPKDFAVLYRTHAQSRAIEEALIMSGFPYQIIGGLKFYERKEVKDILAYLKLIVNPTDSIALERIYNIPPRGIGKSIIEKIRNNNEKSIIAALAITLESKNMPPRQLTAAADFHKLLTNLAETSEKKNLREIIKYIIKKLGYEDYLKEFSLSKTNDYENLEDRLENLKELQTVASKYDELPGKEGIEKFLEEVALLQHTDKLRNDPNRITLMTIHASKGLEFPVVFIIGMEEGLFPHSRTTYNPHELEEERRLCYVAVTRAKEHLILTYTKYRRIFGSSSATLPSRFIGEIPTELAEYQLIDTDYDSEDKIFY